MFDDLNDPEPTPKPKRKNNYMDNVYAIVYSAHSLNETLVSHSTVSSKEELDDLLSRYSKLNYKTWVFTKDKAVQKAIIITLKLSKNPDHNPRNKIEAKCPLFAYNSSCTDSTGEHHSIIFTYDDHKKAIKTIENIKAWAHVTRVEWTTINEYTR